MSVEVSFGKTVSLLEAAKLIAANPQNRFFLQGEPGIGKTSLLKTIKNLLNYELSAYVDAASLELGDTAVPFPNKEDRIMEYFPNGRFKLHMKKPLVIMIDEWSKAPPPVQNMLHPLLEEESPRFGDMYLTSDTVVVLTGNLTTDGVGDLLKAHTRNRVVMLKVRKPTAKEWIAWAYENDIAPEVISYVDKDPEVLASYMDHGQENNLRIFNPRRPDVTCVTPRSLASVSRIVKNRHKAGVGDDALIAALCGAIGEVAGRELHAMVKYSDQIPNWEDIVSSPASTKLPESPGAMSVMTHMAVVRIEADTFDAVMEYMERMPKEFMSMFMIQCANTPSKLKLATKNRKFAVWFANNQDLL